MPTSLLTLPVEIRQIIWKHAMTGQFHFQPDLCEFKDDGEYVFRWWKVPTSERDLLGCQNPRLPLLLTCKVVKQEVEHLSHGYVFEMHEPGLKLFYRKLHDYPDWNRSIFLKVRHMLSVFEMTDEGAKFARAHGAAVFAEEARHAWQYIFTKLSKGIDVKVEVLEPDGSPLRAPLPAQRFKKYKMELYFSETPPAEALPTKTAPTKAPPTKTAPTKTAPTKTAPTKAAPTKAAPTKAAPTKAAPTKTASTDPAPTNPATTNPAPTETAPTETAPTETSPTA
jgi:hypothetical protein